MKSLYLRSSLAALACALTLSACGGDNGNLALAVQVSGLTKDGLILKNNGGPAFAVPANTTTAVFPQLISSDAEYNVTVEASPSNAVCTAYNNRGTARSFDVTSVAVNCVTNTYELGGKVVGLDVNGLVLVNGSDRVAVPAGATSFVFTRKNADGSEAGKVADGSPYGVTILTQPTGRTCTVTNGVGLMGGARVDTIQVTCA